MKDPSLGLMSQKRAQMKDPSLGLKKCWVRSDVGKIPFARRGKDQKKSRPKPVL
jgi:hypothetical protein